MGAAFLVSVPGAVAAQAQPDDAAKLVEARAIVQVVSPPADREKMLSTLLPKVAAQMRPALPPVVASDPALKALVDSSYDDFMEAARPVLLKHMPDIMDATAVAYTHEFSLDELKSIRAFAETPAGIHYLSHSASLLGDPAVARANSAMIADIQQLTAAKKAELMNKLTAYLKVHPDIAKKVADAEAAEAGK